MAFVVRKTFSWKYGSIELLLAPEGVETMNPAFELSKGLKGARSRPLPFPLVPLFASFLLSYYHPLSHEE